MKNLFVIVLPLLVALAAQAQPHEADYVRSWCDARGGISEFQMADKTRADCYLNDFVAEFDFGGKWAECIGQAQHYAAILHRESVPRRPLCVLIQRERTSDKQFARYSARAHSAAAAAGVVVRCLLPDGQPRICPLW